jgi:uncharacterized repeat protein (TIGR03803 family)
MAVILTTLASFNLSNGTYPNGGDLQGSLIADANGDFFGTTIGGGAYGYGTVFEIVKTASGYASTPTTLVSFNGSNGANPYGGLIADANGDLFGTTENGGAYGTTAGTVFEIVKTASGYASTPTTLVSFGSDSNPKSDLIADANGDLFGTTLSGTVFEIVKTASDYASTPTTLVTFNGSDGAAPYGSLIADAHGDLFGTTVSGGANGTNDGTVFEIVKTASGYASTPTTLVSFNGSNGANPYGSLIADAKGDLFGTTSGMIGSGGVNGDGTVFEIAKTASGYASTPTTLISFNGSNGANPFGSLIADAKGDLFGTTAYGGTYNDGTVFEIVKTASGYASTPTVLVSFNADDGANPYCSLIADANGDLFGTTVGVTGGGGTVFEITGSGFIPLAISGLVASQQTSKFQLINPFASVQINDVTSSQTETVTVTSSTKAPLGLNLFDPNAAADGSHFSKNAYTVTGSAAAVTADLEGLVFNAGSGTTNFTIQVTDSAGAAATAATSIVSTKAPANNIVAAGSGENQPVGLDQSVALLSQYMASAFATTGSADSGIHAADPGGATSLQNFLARPQHT